MLTIGLAAVGCIGGGLVGAWWAERNSTGGWDFTPVFTIPIGALVGTFVGVIAGEIIGR